MMLSPRLRGRGVLVGLGTNFEASGIVSLRPKKLKGCEDFGGVCFFSCWWAYFRFFIFYFIFIFLTFYFFFTSGRCVF
jgi:hypothetical protein